MPVAFPSPSVALRGMVPAARVLLCLGGWWCLSLVGGSPRVHSADISQAVKLYKSGQYVECVRTTAEAIEDGQFSETWRIVKIEAELALGRYPDALETLEAALKRYRFSVRLRWLGREVYLYNAKPDTAIEVLDEIDQLFQQTRWRYRDPASLMVVGQYLLHRGADPKAVLDRIYDPVKKQHPNSLPSYIVSGELALEKHDFGLAAEMFQQAAKVDPTDPQVCYGLARAYRPSDSQESKKWLATALQSNRNHIDSLLLIVDGHIDSERYADARQVLDRIGRINALHPLAWAYRAVLAHLNNEPERESQCRQKALQAWPHNPEVDHLIGKKLSQKYRFAEGSSYQRQALRMDADYIPAKIQLSQDLLRLGEEQEGWQLADEVYNKDGFNVVAHNLVTLQDNLAAFTTREGDGFVLRMQAREANIYGARVLDLLRRAKARLCPKYDVDIDGPVIVELFPRQQDFAIRTFGLPGGAGFLGVCFGRVITANSPASQGESPANWQATLWHEFCHVVTLQKTNNKMPRWLSEGISVYEERQADPSWGQSMNPEYREMVLGDDLTPVSQLSAAFLNPPSPQHLQFAYFESALVVEYLVHQYGIGTLKRILVDLGVGMPINDALQRYAGSLEALDKEFAEFARQRAQQLAPEVDWEKPDLPPGISSKLIAAWNEDHPMNYWGLQRYCRQLIVEKDWSTAKQSLRQLLNLYPEHTGPDNAYLLLAAVHRELGETKQERQVLETLAELDADAVDVYLRLMQLCAESEDWQATMTNAQRMLAVNPLRAAPHRFMVQAAAQTGDDTRAIESYRSLLLMEPIDPAQLHYELARLLYKTGDLKSSRRQVLQSLEEAPRFRDAHRLLLQLVRSPQEDKTESILPEISQLPEDEKL